MVEVTWLESADSESCVDDSVAITLWCSDVATSRLADTRECAMLASAHWLDMALASVLVASNLAVSPITVSRAPLDS
eukprot:CAMPEP_0182930418 /NCGR_PEP_ID=MMETSP0105_2-20130417/24986_1 /TAXON_ID=81532 ORGANISM="Acanthoeca-like sp., Strain 10tr" /NCGR_SAMPLE_ID=MMETSP0105_2 /ASSEMBLY_ACC=CAM_ASM_000205 /LENGTH=76 /DNA_ID=CAMNT_0025068689 /DNA_START=12 /DNA_END=239 /DNA_ORIENTATION=-